MRQGDCLTAVVFTQAEETLGFVKAVRTLASVMADWSSLNTGNLCVLVFRQDTLRGIQEQLNRLRFPALQKFVAGTIQDEGRGSVRVATPGQAELERLLRLMHSRQGFRMADWREAATWPGRCPRCRASWPGTGTSGWSG